MVLSNQPQQKQTSLPVLLYHNFSVAGQSCCVFHPVLFMYSLETYRSLLLIFFTQSILPLQFMSLSCCLAASQLCSCKTMLGWQQSHYLVCIITVMRYGCFVVIVSCTPNNSVEIKRLKTFTTICTSCIDESQQTQKFGPVVLQQ